MVPQGMINASTEIHVVLVNYNSAECFLRCLESLPLATIASVTVLDNQSTENDRALLLTATEIYPKLRIVLSEKNLGFGAGMNQAVSESPARPDDILWLLNPDTLVRKDSLSALIAALAERPDHIVSPVILTGADSQECWFSGGTIDTSRGQTLHWRDRPSPGGATFVECSFLTGAAPLLTMNTWSRLGGFREDLFMYWEDADLSIRARTAGIGLGVATRSEIWHAVGASSTASGKSALWHYFMQRNRLIVCSQEQSKLSLLLGRGFPATLRLFVRAMRERHEKFDRMRSSLRGIFDGLTTR